MALSREEQERWLEGLTGDELLWFGVELYNAGHYWHAHEAWEQVWMEAPNELRAFYQGLIQVTAAFVHVVRSEYPGSVRLLEEGIAKLERYPASFMRIDLGGLVAGARAARALLVELGERRIGEFDRELVPGIQAVGNGGQATGGQGAA
jgi:predicted metal-dependent hydrolase